MQGATSPTEIQFWSTRDATKKKTKRPVQWTAAYGGGLSNHCQRVASEESPRRIASAMLVPPGPLSRHANAEEGAAKTRSNRHVLSNARISD